MDITLKQIENMKHAIGFQRDRVKRGKYIAFRNYYTTNDINLSWENLVEFGYATRRKLNGHVGDNGQVYFVAKKGFELLERLFEVKIVVDKT